MIILFSCVYIFPRMKVRMALMMLMMNSMSKSVSSSAYLKKRAKKLVDKLSYVEDTIKKAELSGQKRRSPKAEEWLGRVNSHVNEVSQLRTKTLESEETVKLLLLSGGILPELIETVDMLIDQTPHLDELVIDVCEKRGGMVGEAFEKNFERVWRLLEGREVSSIGIYGMAGAGKTALAKCINNRLLEQSQSSVPVFWITVSPKFTIASLQEKIARLIGVNLLDDDDADTRAAILHRALLQMKHSVLILDDVWECIDPLKVGCPISAECCRLIVTTRSLEVCRQIPCQKVITVDKLREDEAWELFTETLTLGEDIGELSPQVKETAKSVARFCDGLPLGIIKVAGSMRGMTSIHSWRVTLTELEKYVASQDVMEEVFEIIRSSFNLLNRKECIELNWFQLCFLYCSLYPQGDVLDRDELVERFISKGFLDERMSKSTQIHQGHSILNKLVNVCLLETSVSPPGIKMHGLVRGMALKIIERNHMVKTAFKEIHDEHNR